MRVNAGAEAWAVEPCRPAIGAEGGFGELLFISQTQRVPRLTASSQLPFSVDFITSPRPYVFNDLTLVGIWVGLSFSACQ